MKSNIEELGKLAEARKLCAPSPWYEGEDHVSGYVTWQAHEDERGGIEPMSDYNGREPLVTDIRKQERNLLTMVGNMDLSGAFAEWENDKKEIERLKKENESWRKIANEGRAAGRAEAMMILMSKDAETWPADSSYKSGDACIYSYSIADTGDYGTSWHEKNLRKLFNIVDDKETSSFIEELEGRMYDLMSHVICLDRTADGVPITPGMSLFSSNRWKAKTIAVLDDPNFPNNFEQTSHVDCLYSTPQESRKSEHEKLIEEIKLHTGNENFDKWMDTPNKAFGGLKPNELIERNEDGKLWDMIFQIKSGVAN